MKIDSFTEAVLSTSLDGVVVMDEAGIVTAWNGNAERIFGYSAQDAVGRQMADLIIPAERRAAHLAGLSRFLLTGEVRILGKRVRLAALHRDGHEVPVELAMTLSSRLGSNRFLGFLRDLTSEVEAEAEIRRLNAELLQVSRLNAMGTAASMIAHEINQSLATATNYLAVCQNALDNWNSTAPDVLSSSISGAQNALLRSAEIVRVIRNIVSARPVQRSKVALSLIISESLTLLKGTLPTMPSIKIDADAHFVSVAKGPIEQVFLNIFKNAAEALCGCRDPQLSCSARRVKDFVEVRISDNGYGISNEARSKLFSPNKSLKKDGLGIGLSISREIIEHHGGKIWLQSQPSVTAFCFTLPAALNSKAPG